MGIAGSPDIFQDKMSDLMAPLEFVRTYLDDVPTITNSTFSDHLEKLEQVLKKLDEAGLRVNVSKSHFCTSELEYLGYVLTRDGIKPSNRLYRWRLLLEEYDLEIVYIPGIQNTVADTISRIEYDPMVNPASQCMHIQWIRDGY